MEGLLPEGDNVLVDPIRRSGKIGSFNLPVGVKGGTQTRAVVLAVGPWVKSPSLKVGETVVMKSYSGTPVQHQGKECLIVPTQDLLYVEG